LGITTAKFEVLTISTIFKNQTCPRNGTPKLFLSVYILYLRTTSGLHFIWVNAYSQE